MTPQGNFMILAPIVPSREAELRGLLDSMNEAPGCVNPNNPLVPFAQPASVPIRSTPATIPPFAMSTVTGGWNGPWSVRPLTFTAIR